MTKTEEKSKSVIKSKANNTMEKNGRNTIFDLVYRMKEPIGYALSGTTLSSDRFIRLVITELRNNPRLASCTPESFLGAMLQAAQLGLEPNTSLGEAYLIPYGNKAQFQLGYRGLLTLANRTGTIEKFDAQTVYENDVFEYQLGWDSKLVHIPAMKDRGNPIGYYGLYKTKTGGGNFCFMSVEDVTKHAKKFSKTFNNGPWQTDFDSMAKKTVLKQALKYAPLSVELQRVLQADESVKSIEISEVDKVNPLDLTPEIITENVEGERDTQIDNLQKELSPENIFN